MEESPLVPDPDSPPNKSTDEQAEDEIQDDEPRGWIVVAACFFTVAVLDGICYTFGIFMDPLRDDIGGGTLGLAAVGSIQVSIYFFVGPLAGRMVDRFGCRPVCMTGAAISAIGIFAGSFSQGLTWLIVTYSVLGGFGFGLMFIPAVVAPTQHFNKKRALATGIAVCGTGIGMLTMPPLADFLLANFGWRGAYRILAGLVFFCVACGAAMLKPKVIPAKPQSDEERHNLETSAEPSILMNILNFLVGRELLSSPNFNVFVCIMLGDLLATMSMYIPYTLLPEMAMSRGISETDAAYLISAAGISSTVGRVFAGWLCDRRWLHPVTITFFATAVAALQAFLLASCVSYWQFIVLTSLFGFLTGVWVACETPLCIRILRLDLLTAAFGLMIFNGGLAALTGPPLAGMAVDLSKNDKGIAFYITGGIMSSSALAYALAMFVNKFKSRKSLQYSGYQQL